MASSSQLKLPKVRFKVALVEAARRQLAFLAEVEGTRPHLYTGPAVRQAIRRYQDLWLPLLASQPVKARLMPPLDVHWVWHCHMLAPRAYEEDCRQLASRVLDHALLSKSDHAAAVKRARAVWERMYPQEPFDLDLSSAQPVEFESKLRYNLEEAVQRQASFVYQVGLPHYRDSQFLKKAQDRYIKYVLLKDHHKDQPMVTCYDIDLMWHAHLLHPLTYKQDINKVMGQVLNHDDSISDRGPESKLSKAHQETRKLWTQIYEESLEVPGALYRGESPAGRLGLPLTEAETSKFWQKKTKITLEKFQTLNLEVDREAYLKVMLTNQQDKDKQITKLKVTPEGQIADENVSKKFQFDSSIDDVLNFELRDKQGCIGFSKETILMTGTYHLLQEVENMGAEGCNKGMSVTLVRTSESGNRDLGGFVQVGFSVYIEPPVLGPCVLRLDGGDFHAVEMPEHLADLWGPISHAVLPPGLSNGCILARHRLVSPGRQRRLRCQVMHSIPLMMSAVQVYTGDDNMAALSHLVATDQLPLQGAVQSSKVPSLSAEAGSRAMLIKDGLGDWGLLIGKWIGRKPGVPGSPGNLHLTFYNLRDHVTQTQVLKQEVVTFKEVTCDLGSGSVAVRSGSSPVLAQCVCLALSVAVLYALCEPRPVRKVDLSTVHHSADHRDVTIGDGEDQDGSRSENYRMLRAVGYLHDIPCNSYLKNYLPHSGCSQCWDGEAE